MTRRSLAVAAVLTLAVGLGLGVGPARAVDIRVGGVINVNRSSLTTDHPNYRDALESSVRSGFGGVLEVGLMGGLSLVTEPMFVGKGAQVGGSGSGTSGTTGALKLDYFEVPVYAKLRFGDGALKPYLLAGPALGFETGAHRSLDGQGAGSLDLNDRIKGADASLAAGGGVAVKILGAEAFVEAAQSWGLRDVGDILNIGDQGFAGITKTRGLQIRFGVTFKIG